MPIVSGARICLAVSFPALALALALALGLGLVIMSWLRLGLRGAMYFDMLRVTYHARAARRLLGKIN